MSVFFKDEHGDIWGGESREAIEEEMLQEDADANTAGLESVPSDYKINAGDENDEPTEELITLDDEFTTGLGAYKVCISGR